LQNSESNSNDRAAIDALHMQDMAAAKNMDIETLLSLWTDDGVLLQPGQEPLVGRDAIDAYMKKAAQKEEAFEIIEYVHTFEEIKILGDWAYEWGTFKGCYRSKSSTDLIHETARLFRILRKQTDGSWKCARAIWHELP
jgi:uncharacterized protein (TIGR02246 family)